MSADQQSAAPAAPPEPVSFPPKEIQKECDEIVARYPTRMAACLPILHVAQRHYGGWVSPEARWPEVSIDIPVGAMRAYEFVADNPGRWALHCHVLEHAKAGMMGWVLVEPNPDR